MDELIFRKREVTSGESVERDSSLLATMSWFYSRMDRTHRYLGRECLNDCDVYVELALQ